MLSLYYLILLTVMEVTETVVITVDMNETGRIVPRPSSRTSQVLQMDSPTLATIIVTTCLINATIVELLGSFKIYYNVNIDIVEKDSHYSAIL